MRKSPGAKMSRCQQPCGQRSRAESTRFGQYANTVASRRSTWPNRPVFVRVILRTSKPARRRVPPLRSKPSQPRSEYHSTSSWDDNTALPSDPGIIFNHLTAGGSRRGPAAPRRGAGVLPPQDVRARPAAPACGECRPPGWRNAPPSTWDRAIQSRHGPHKSATPCDLALRLVGGRPAGIATWSAYPSIAAAPINPRIDAMGQEETFAQFLHIANAAGTLYRVEKAVRGESAHVSLTQNALKLPGTGRGLGRLRVQRIEACPILLDEIADGRTTRCIQLLQPFRNRGELRSR